MFLRLTYVKILDSNPWKYTLQPYSADGLKHVKELSLSLYPKKFQVHSVCWGLFYLFELIHMFQTTVYQLIELFIVDNEFRDIYKRSYKGWGRELVLNVLILYPNINHWCLQGHVQYLYRFLVIFFILSRVVSWKITLPLPFISTSVHCK